MDPIASRFGACVFSALVILTVLSGLTSPRSRATATESAIPASHRSIDSLTSGSATGMSLMLIIRLPRWRVSEWIAYLMAAFCARTTRTRGVTKARASVSTIHPEESGIKVG